MHDFNATDDRALVVLRVDHHRALVNTATRAGVEIVTSSTAVGADPDGTLIMENGDRHSADLVIGCDGYNSKVRDSLGLAKFVGFVTEARIGRVTIPRDERPETEMIQNFWNGPRRCGLLGCGPVNYIYLSAPENCPHNVDEVSTRSLYKPVWIEAFPFLKEKWEIVNWKSSGAISDLRMSLMVRGTRRDPREIPHIRCRPQWLRAQAARWRTAWLWRRLSSKMTTFLPP